MNNMIKTLFAGALLVIPAAVADARPDYYNQFNTQYPDNMLQSTFVCNICHMAGGGAGWNPYGENIRSLGEYSPIPFSQYESIDSDGDGTTNLSEIMANTHPGRATALITSGFIAGAVPTLPATGGSVPGDVNFDLITDAADIVETLKTTDFNRAELVGRFLGDFEADAEYHIDVCF